MTRVYLENEKARAPTEPSVCRLCSCRWAECPAAECPAAAAKARDLQLSPGPKQAAVQLGLAARMVACWGPCRTCACAGREGKRLGPRCSSPFSAEHVEVT